MSASILPLCLTPGDPMGIGPEITLKFLNNILNQQNIPLVQVIGSCKALRQQMAVCGLPWPEHTNINYINIDCDAPGDVSYQSLVKAVETIAAGKARGLVTGPISKANLQDAKLPYSGHTEILQDLANQYFPKRPDNVPYQADMLFVYRKFRMLLLTRHIALKDVSAHLKPGQIETSLNSLIAFLREQAKISLPKLGILGVNPHAGEMQHYDEFCEERDIIIPVLKKLEKEWQLSIDNPLAADAAFRGFDPGNPDYDCYVAAYHDQGLIPMKLVAGMQAVNVTIGLPFVRTSVSHGTAPDIAGQGIADFSALSAAFDLADTYT